MTQKQFVPKRGTQPTLESITQDVFQLGHDALLELRAVIDRLLEAQTGVEVGVLQRGD